MEETRSARSILLLARNRDGRRVIVERLLVLRVENLESETT